MPADDTKERTRALDMAVSQIEKQFGKGSIMRLGQKDAVAQIASIPTGFDQHRLCARRRRHAAGPRHRNLRAGVVRARPRWRCRSSRRLRRLGGMAAFVDAEHALDATYANKLGVDLDNLLVSQPDNGEQALEIVEVLVRSSSVDVVVVDSVAALVPKAEIEGEMGEAQMGLQARLMSQALRKLTGVVSKSKHLPDLHQPAPREDRRDVRQPRNHHGRPRAEVLLVGAHRHPPHREHQGWRSRWSAAARASRS